MYRNLGSWVKSLIFSTKYLAVICFKHRFRDQQNKVVLQRLENETEICTSTSLYFQYNHKSFQVFNQFPWYFVWKHEGVSRKVILGCCKKGYELYWNHVIAQPNFEVHISFKFSAHSQKNNTYYDLSPYKVNQTDFQTVSFWVYHILTLQDYMLPISCYVIYASICQTASYKLL